MRTPSTRPSWRPFGPPGSIYIPFTRWELLYWNLMRFNPGARYRTGGELTLPSRDTLMLLSIAPRVDGTRFLRDCRVGRAPD